MTAILLEGYFATEQRQLLKKLLPKGMKAYIWTSIDPMGLTIQQEAGELVASLGGEAEAVFFEPQLLENGVPLSENERQELEVYCQNNQPPYFAIAQKMLSCGLKFPQEKVLSLIAPEQLVTILRGGKSCGRLL